ncbi:N-terminal Xaa-Pro-Lys N-methyltransferase 1 [Leguminivora glycinivorella]|uniref:N-terminal Xaa-Pro-Lys N-methyltransferase 1 n=1 Tax=Leguminivora glycinivorella TaxID=1035111 RepID=UPI00200FFA9B|nr:N-terminal Xaa-Pro-Lys N-methyltransferase 1 [Leguminivora glycinivorella]
MSENIFYTKAAKYWANVPATINGVLGGYEHISGIDIKGSKAFLNDILSLKNAPGTELALDCGAGIGRIAQYLLIPVFDKVDLVEQEKRFLSVAKRRIGELHERLGSLYNIGLQHFTPKKKYDVIWCQWVLGHLNDIDLIAFLVRCKKALNTNGVIVVKENITASEEIEYDDEDSSVARPYKLMQLIFKEANLELIKESVQDGFPDDIYKVYLFALVPNDLDKKAFVLAS